MQEQYEGGENHSPQGRTVRLVQAPPDSGRPFSTPQPTNRPNIQTAGRTSRTVASGSASGPVPVPRRVLCTWALHASSRSASSVAVRAGPRRAAARPGDHGDPGRRDCQGHHTSYMHRSHPRAVKSPDTLWKVFKLVKSARRQTRGPFSQRLGVRHFKAFCENYTP